MRHIYKQLFAFTAFVAIGASGANADYSADSYVLSEDGQTLESWKGAESEIDMNSDQALSGVTTIANNAFRGLDVESVIVGDNVTSIGKWAFFGCTKLSSVSLPDGLELLDNAAFSGCSELASVVIPDGMTEINPSTFYDCSSLAKVVLPESLTVINDGAFANCESLTSIIIPTGVTRLGEESFSSCRSLRAIDLPEALTFIGSAAFEECASLKSVKFVAAIDEIETSAFTGCGIESLDLSMLADVSFGSNVFAVCPELKEVVLPPTYSSMGTGFLQECTSLATLTIPDTWNEIPAKLCFGCTGLDTLDMGDGVQAIKQGAFFECSLSNLTWSEKVTDIQWNVFYGCTGISELKLPDSLQTVDDYSFSACPALKSIRIGVNAESFGQECFSMNESLETVVCEAVTPPTLGAYAFYKSNTDTASLQVPEESLDAYKEADQWKEFVNISQYSGVAFSIAEAAGTYTVVRPDGVVIVEKSEELPALPTGLYIINGRPILR